MTIHVEPIKRVRMYEEPNGSFAEDHSGTIGDFTDIPFVEGSVQLTLTRQTLETQDLQQRQDDWSQDVLGLRRATLQGDLNLAPTGSAAGDTTAAVQGPVGLILKAIMGGEELGTGTTVDDASATTTSFDVASAAGLAAGGALGWVNGNGEMEVREIASVSGTTVTLAEAFSSAPANSDTLYASATYYLRPSNGGNSTSLQAIVEGLESDDRWLLLGGQAESVSLNISPSTDGVIPRMTVSILFATWLYGDEASTDLTASSLADATYSNYEAIALNDGEFRFPTASGTASSPLHVSAVEFSPNISWGPVTSPSGTEIILQWIRRHNTPAIQGSFTLPFEDHTHFDDRDSRTEKAAHFQIGRSAGGSVQLSAPACQITDAQRVDADGIAGQQVSWKGRVDNNKTGTDDVQLTAFRVHLV